MDVAAAASPPATRAGSGVDNVQNFLEEENVKKIFGEDNVQIFFGEDNV